MAAVARASSGDYLTGRDESVIGAGLLRRRRERGPAQGAAAVQRAAGSPWPRNCKTSCMSYRPAGLDISQAAARQAPRAKA